MPVGSLSTKSSTVRKLRFRGSYVLGTWFTITCRLKLLLKEVNFSLSSLHIFLFPLFCPYKHGWRSCLNVRLPHPSLPPKSSCTSWLSSVSFWVTPARISCLSVLHHFSFFVVAYNVTFMSVILNFSLPVFPRWSQLSISCYWPIINSRTQISFLLCYLLPWALWWSLPREYRGCSLELCSGW